MNEHEIERIAAAVNVLRPDWPTASLRTLLGRPELVRRPRGDVAVALVWVACDSASKTPARVIEAGPWWRAAAAGGSDADRTPRPPRAHEICHLCQRHADRCICRDDEGRPTGPTLTPPRPSEYADDYLETLRAEARRPKERA